MNRYKFSETQFPAAIKYLKTGTGQLDAPNWALKHKDDLKVKGKSIFWKEREIIPKEKVDDFLRQKLYDKKCEVGFGRDSAFYTLSKTFVGLPRRRIMAFLRAQKTLGETRAAVPQARRKAGPPLKRLTLETDLCFIRKNDLVRSNPRFEKTHKKNEVYCLTTVEKSSSLCKLDYLTTKEANVVTPKVIEHIHWFAKRFGKKAKDFDLAADKGGEFRMKDLAKIVNTAKNVNTGVAVEKMNLDFQKNFYRILKNRQSVSIPDAIFKAQKLCNNTMSSIHRKTPNEVVDQKVDTLKKYNATRKSYIAGDRRNDFQVGQHVRILVKKAKGSIEFKSYKGKTWSNEVYLIKKKTKTTTPTKFYVNKRWLTIDSLLRSAPRDLASNALIKARDEKQSKADREREEEADRKRDADFKANEKRKAKLRAEGKLAKLRDSKKVRDKMKKRAEEEKAKDIEIEEAEEEFQADKKAALKRPKAKRKKTSTDPSVQRFKELIHWTDGEENKTYSGVNEAKLEKLYNARIREGKQLAAKLRKKKVKLAQISYFDAFEF